MDIKKKKTTAAKSSTEENGEVFASVNVPRMPKELEIHADESCTRFKVDEDAERILGNIIRTELPISIYLETLDLMRGLNPKLAMKVADYIGDFCWGMGRTVTGIEFLDNHLLNLYKRIFEYTKANGIKLEMDCPF